MDDLNVMDNSISDMDNSDAESPEQPALEDIVGEMIENGESFETIPDLISDVLEGDTYNDIPFEDVPEEEVAGNDNNNSSNAAGSPVSQPQIRRSNDTYSKIDSSVEGIQIRDEKIVEIRNSTEEEGREKGWSEEQIQEKVSERVDDLKQELLEIRSDIEHYRGLLDSLNESGNPLHLRSMTSYQLLRYETDAACRSYIKAGGAVGKDCFLQRGVSASQLGMSAIDVFRSNAIEGAVLSKVSDIKIGFEDIYKGTRAGASIVGKIASPFMAVGKVLGYVPGSVLSHIFEGIDKAVGADVSKDDENPVDVEKPDNTDDATVVETDIDVQQTFEEMMLPDIGKPEEPDTDKPENGNTDLDKQSDIDHPEGENQTDDDIKDSADTENSDSPIEAEPPELDIQTENQLEDQVLDTSETEPSTETEPSDSEVSSEPVSEAEVDPGEKPEDTETGSSREDMQDIGRETIVSDEEEPEEQIEENEPAEENSVDIQEDAETDDTTEDTEDGNDPDEEEKSDSVTAEVSGDDEDSDADADDSVYQEKSESADLDKDEADGLEQQTDPQDHEVPDDSSMDAGEQNDALEDNTDLAVESLEADNADTEETLQDAEIQMTDIVDNAVQSIENGVSESEVLSEAAGEIADFYESQLSDGDVSMEDTINTIADAVHEMASVFESPAEAADIMLEGIPDEAVTDALRQQIESVDADMTTDATGSFGSLEYDSSGNVVDQMEQNNANDLFENSGIDIDSTVDALDAHMESAVDTPELQEIVTNEQIPEQTGVDTGMDSAVDSGMEGTQDIMQDTASGAEEAIEEIIAALL